MKFRLGPVGPRGLALLAVTALIGVLLASHGWATYRGAAAPGSLGRAAAATSSAPTAAPTTPAKHAPAATARPTVRPTASPSSPRSSPGPLLASEAYAQYSFQVWPGPVSAAAKAALTGLSVSVRSEASGLSITASVNGQPAGSAHVYPGGARVYIVEASMGDDSGNSDYNLGDDGLVVTDAQGRVLQ